MSEPQNSGPGPEEQTPEFEYASPVKRAWAWVGIAYMLITTLTFTYYLATAAVLEGIGPLMVVPALAGAAATAILRYRSGEGRGGLGACVLISAACGVLIALNLLRGIPALLGNFGGVA